MKFSVRNKVFRPCSSIIIRLGIKKKVRRISHTNVTTTEASKMRDSTTVFLVWWFCSSFQITPVWFALHELELKFLENTHIFLYPDKRKLICGENMSLSDLAIRLNSTHRLQTTGLYQNKAHLSHKLQNACTALIRLPVDQLIHGWFTIVWTMEGGM